MQNFRSLQLAVEFYSAAKQLRLPSRHRDQMLRAASSIALNLAEGSAKSSVADRKRFYQIAAELEAPIWHLKFSCSFFVS